MILRRIADGFRKQDWFVVGVEIMTVVIGLFIGLQVDDWNEQRQEHERERAYIQSMQGDIEAIINIFETRSEFIEGYAAMVKVTLDTIEQQPSPERDNRLADLLWQTVARRTLAVESPTYVDLLSSGRLNLISDKDLRDQIITFFGRLHQISLVIEKNNNLTLDQYYKSFLFNAGVGYWLPEEYEGNVYGDEELELREFHQNHFDARVFRQDSAIYHLPASDPLWDEFRRHMSLRVYDFGTDQFYGNIVLDEAKALIVSMSDYLERS